MKINKKELFDACLIKINNQIEKYQKEMDNIKESMEANDVHTDYDEEGSKGELLGDFEKYATYLDNSQKMKQQLSKIDREHYSENVKFGSIVKTPKNYYFISTALGEVLIDDTKVNVISTEAPIYKELEGKKAGDKFTWRDEEIEIEEVH